MNGNNLPLVSVIINCYNSDRYLKETLDSVLSQSYKNWEIIFWDNQSIDKSAQYFNNYNDSRFKYFYAPEHTSLSTARNLAAFKAEGSFLAFLDCDDVWLPEKLSIQINSALNDDIGFVYSKFELLLSSDHISAKVQASQYLKLNDLCQPHESKDLYKILLLGNYIIFSSVLIKKQTFDKVGGFKNNLSQNEDYELLLKASLISKACCVDYIGVKYRIHQSNNSHLNAEKNFVENKIIFSSLPESRDVFLAQKRDQIKYGLFKIFVIKNLIGVKDLLSPYTPRFIIEILLKRIRNKVRENVQQ